MAEVYVLDDIPFSAPRFNTHLELAQICVGSAEKMRYMDPSTPAFEWERTSRGTLERLATESGVVSHHQKPLVENMYRATQLIGDALPKENPELNVVLSAVARIFDSELEIQKLALKLAPLEEERSRATRDLLTAGIRGVSLADIETVNNSRA